jgi:hypothetical protein
MLFTIMKYSKLLSSIILVIVLSACTSKEIQAETLIKESEVQTATAHDSSAPRYTKTAKIPLSQLHGHFEYNVGDNMGVGRQFGWNFRMFLDYQPQSGSYKVRSEVDDDAVGFMMVTYNMYLYCLITELARRNQAKTFLFTWEKKLDSEVRRIAPIPATFLKEGAVVMLSPDDLTKQIPALKKRYPNWEFSKEMVSDVTLDNEAAKEVCRLYQSPFADN